MARPVQLTLLVLIALALLLAVWLVAEEGPGTAPCAGAIESGPTDHPSQPNDEAKLPVAGSGIREESSDSSYGSAPPASGADEVTAETAAPQSEPSSANGHIITVRIVDPFSRDVIPEKLLLQLLRKGDAAPVWRIRLGSAERRAGGPYLIQSPQEHLNTPDMSLEIYIYTKEFGPTRLTVSFPTDEVLVQLQEPAYLILDVPNAAGYADQRVGWKLVGEMGTFYVDRDSPSTDEESGGGVYLSPFRSALVPPGAYSLEIVRVFSVKSPTSRAPGGWDDLVLKRYPLELKAGRNDFTLQYPALHQVTVQSAVELSGELQLISPDDGVLLTTVVKEEVLTFPYVPEGDWILCDWLGRQRVSVNGDGQVAFEPLDADCLIVGEIGLEHPLAQAGFQAGDRVTMQDDQDLASFRGLKREVSGSQTLSRWTVERGSHKLEITFNQHEAEESVKRLKLPWPLEPGRREGWPPELVLPTKQ